MKIFTNKIIRPTLMNQADDDPVLSGTGADPDIKSVS
jgi:hypothetical protein